MNVIMKKFSWDKIVENYPDTWVVLTACQMEDHAIVSGKIVAVCKTNKESLMEENLC